MKGLMNVLDYRDTMKKFDTAVILAGGKSTRMGFDKQFLRMRKVNLIHYLIKKLNNEFKEIIIVTNTPSYYKDLPYKIVSDEIKEKGPLSGIHVGLKNATSEYVYFIACDMPNVNLDYIKFMKNKLKDITVNACVTRLGKHIEPFNAFYSKNIIEDIETKLSNEQRSVSLFIKSLNSIYIKEQDARKFSPNWEMFINLNTKEDLIKYLG